VPERDGAVAHMVNAALNMHADDPAFGYRFIADKLPEKGITAGENRVQPLCRTLRDQGRLFRQDHRLLDGLADEVLAGRRRTVERRAGTPPGRNGGALGPRYPVPVPPVR
jgi:hypothetical protein